jgi:hypothetical protein
MRLSEILESEVLDVEGRRIGRVHDVRLVREGPPQGTFGPSYQLSGLIIGGAAVGSRLGYGRGGIEGPWPLKTFFRRLERKRGYVDWAAVESVQGGMVRLLVGADACRVVPPLPRH